MWWGLGWDRRARSWLEWPRVGPSGPERARVGPELARVGPSQGVTYGRILDFRFDGRQLM